MMEIVSAPWVVVGDGPIIKEGAIVIGDDRIVDIGERYQITCNYSNLLQKHYPCVLMPGFVNSHMHLELSYLHDVPEPQHDQNFTDWIASLLSKRAACQDLRETIIEKFLAALEDQYRSGVVLIGDIGNDYFEELHESQKELQPKILRMIEFLGPNLESCRTSLEKIKTLDGSVIVTGHGPYSTGPGLLSKIKKRCQGLNHIFSIHTAETQEELEFLRTGGGSFRDFLEKRKSWDGMFTFDKAGFLGTVEYFDHLGILDEKTLLIHCVHVSDSELILIKDRGAHICLCPGSNRFLGVGVPPVMRMVELGLLPCLGTDSPASNSSVDIWREMRLLAESHSSLDHSVILTMAGLGGATALGYESDYGSLTTGKKARFIHVSSDLLLRCENERKLVKELVLGGRPTDIEWVQGVH